MKLYKCILPVALTCNIRGKVHKFILNNLDSFYLQVYHETVEPVAPVIFIFFEIYASLVFSRYMPANYTISSMKGGNLSITLLYL